jgi:Protein of unknown function (DUF2817)
MNAPSQSSLTPTSIPSNQPSLNNSSSSNRLPAVSQHFSPTYQEAREKFLKTVNTLTASAPVRPTSPPHPTHRGKGGEELATDVALIGDPAAKHLLVVSSGMHGVEGYCGSGCQIALMHDQELLARLSRADLAMVMIHAINPYGFSHLRRVNEDNIDMNRNFLDFAQPLPDNPEYAEVHGLMLPAQWPPNQHALDALEQYVQKHGEHRFKSAVTIGQHSHADGLFYSGRAASWSNTTLRHILAKNGEGRQSIAWMDIHTGLGPAGHGEKIFGGQNNAEELARARACWGADVFSIFDGQSASKAVRGSGTSCLPVQCPWAVTTTLGLEFGTLPSDDVLQALRADHWLSNQPGGDSAQRTQIKQDLMDAFILDDAEWRGMVVAQTRVACLQVIAAVGAH